MLSFINVVRPFSGFHFLLKFQRFQLSSEVSRFTRSSAFRERFRLSLGVSPFVRGFVFRPLHNTASHNNYTRTLIYVAPDTRNINLYKKIALFFCLVGWISAPFMFLYGKAPLAGYLAAFAPIPSILFINYMTDTYVSRLFMYLPSSLRYNPKRRKVFNPYMLHASGDPIITIEMYDWLTRRVEIDVRLSELKDPLKKKSLVTWVRDTSNKSSKSKFYVAKSLMNQDPFSKGLVEWIEKNSTKISSAKASKTSGGPKGHTDLQINNQKKNK